MMRLGIDIGATNIKYGIVQFESKIRNYELKITNSVETELQKGRDFVIQKIIFLINKCKEKYNIESIGIGVPGLVDRKSGNIYNPPNLPDWNGINLQNELKDVNLPIYVKNDANCFALGEYVLRKDEKIQNLIGITIGTGIGSGLILNGKIYHGSTGFASEIGHIKVVQNGRKCNCGQKGCLEAYSSAIAIEKMNEEKFGKKIAVDILHKMALNGDESAIRIFEIAFEKLGIVCAGLVNLLNLDVIVFGGGLSNMKEFLLDPVKKFVQKNSYKRIFDNVKIEISKFGMDSAIIGAASLME